VARPVSHGARGEGNRLARASKTTLSPPRGWRCRARRAMLRGSWRLSSMRTSLGRSLALSLTLLVLAAGCAATRQSRGEAAHSGFLRDYSILEPGADGQAQLRWVDPDADFPRYQAVIVDSVALWSGPELAKLSDEEKRALADHAYTALVTALSKSFRIATAPGHDTLRVRAAITEATGSAVAPDVVATVIPQVRLISMLVGRGADTAATVGEASGELEVTDSVTGRVVAAGVDRRVGQRSLRGVFSRWSDVEAAWDAWAELVRARLVASGAGHPPAES
jgi:hypothetical protein